MKHKISITGSTHGRLRARGAKTGDRIAWLAEDAVAPIFSMTEAEQRALADRIRAKMRSSAAARAARKPITARRPAEPEAPIAFWLLPTAPVRRSRR